MKSLARWILAGLALCLASAVDAAPAPGPYRLIVTGIDSSNFPKIKLQFKVLVQQPGVPAWNPKTMPLKIVEGVPAIGSEKDGEDVELEPDPCGIKPVAMGVAVDVSGSVGDVMDQIKQGASHIFSEMKKESDTYKVRDVGAIYAFSDANQYRVPMSDAIRSGGMVRGQGNGASWGQFGQPGASGTSGTPGAATPGTPGTGLTPPAGPPPQVGDGTEIYVGEEGLGQLSEVAQQIPSGGGSPIFQSMMQEVELLSQHDPSNKDLQRVLVSLTDGNDNMSQQVHVDRLRTLAQQAGISLVNIAYGSPSPEADGWLRTLSNESGGVYVQGAMQSLGDVLTAILDGMRKTWCVEYVSPHPHVVNEPALIKIQTGGSEGLGVYPLPFVIPEDSPNVKLFVPVTEDMFKILMAGQDASGIQGGVVLSGANQPVFLKAKAELVTGETVEKKTTDERGEEVTLEEDVPWQPAETADGAPGPDRKVKAFEFQTTDWQEGVKGEPLSGWGVFIGSDKEEWQEMFKVPTDYVSLDVEEGEAVIKEVSHWRITAAIDTPDSEDNSRGSRDIKLGIRVSVQDRTAPSLLVRARPQDGGAMYEARVTPEAVDQDTQILELVTGLSSTLGVIPDFSRPSYEMAKTPGQKAKRARIDYAWRAAGGEAVTGGLADQRWSLYDGARKPIFEQADKSDRAIGETEHKIIEEGLRVGAGIRMSLRVASRDNFALLEKSGLAADKTAFTEPAKAPAKEDQGWLAGAAGFSTDGDADAAPPRPAHAAFDLTAAESEPFAEAAPFFSVKDKAALEDPKNAGEPGVVWWIESKDPADRYHMLEGVTEIRYKLADRVIRRELEAQGLLAPDEPVRVLKVLSQDGQGNHTTLSLPITVVPNGFKATTLEWRTERVRGAY